MLFILKFGRLWTVLRIRHISPIATAI